MAASQSDLSIGDTSLVIDLNVIFLFNYLPTNISRILGKKKKTKKKFYAPRETLTVYNVCHSHAEGHSSQIRRSTENILENFFNETSLHVAQAGLELVIFASAYQRILRLQVCPTTSGCVYS